MNLTHIKKALIIFVCLVVVSFSFLVTAEENSDNNIFLDSDQDGLSNEEEATYGTDPENNDTDGDGYSDGTEVESGYDPLKPAPGDKIITENENDEEANDENIQLTIDARKDTGNDADEIIGKNMTQEVSNKVAELISNRSGTDQNIEMEDIDALIASITLDDTADFDDLPEIDIDKIKIKEQDYGDLSEEEEREKEKEDATKYLVEVAYIAISNSPEKIGSADDIMKFSETVKDEALSFTENITDISYFSDLAEKGEETLMQLEEVEVPENLLELHIKGVRLSQYAASLKNEINLDPSDPIGSMAQLSNVQGLLSLGTQLSKEISSAFKSIGIEEIPLDL